MENLKADGIINLKHIIMSKIKKLWLGTLWFCNQEMITIGNSEKEAKSALRKHYLECKRDTKHYDLQMTFPKYYEYAGGNIQEVEIGKIYYL